MELCLCGICLIYIVNKPYQFLIRNRRLEWVGSVHTSNNNSIDVDDDYDYDNFSTLMWT